MEILMSKEQGFLNIFRDVFPFLELYDIAIISTLNKSFINSLSEHPVALVYMLIKHYLNDQNPHPNKRKYFKYLLRKVNKQALQCSERELAIMIYARDRIKISSNLIRPPQIDKMSPFARVGWRITKNDGDGWLLENNTGPKYRNYALATSYIKSEMIYSVFFYDFGQEFLRAFIKNQVVIKGGCFMSRRWECGARGGCALQISTADGTVVFEKKAERSTEQLFPNKYIQVINEVKYDEIKQYLGLELYLSLKIYGRDEGIWAGHYGTKFFGMYIRGDYINSE